MARMPLFRVLVPLGALCSLFYVPTGTEAAAEHKLVGNASWYSRASALAEQPQYQAITASGEPLDDAALTCALPHRRFGGWYRVCGKAGCAVVRHNDFGPGRTPRARGVVVDLTPRGFALVCGSLSQGVCQITLESVR